MALINIPFPEWAIIAILAWTIPWKGIALWTSARNKQKIWFIVLLLVSTVGVLEILYLLFWQKKRK